MMEMIDWSEYIWMILFFAISKSIQICLKFIQESDFVLQHEDLFDMAEKLGSDEGRIGGNMTNNPYAVHLPQRSEDFASSGKPKCHQSCNNTSKSLTTVQFVPLRSCLQGFVNVSSVPMGPNSLDTQLICSDYPGPILWWPQVLGVQKGPKGTTCPDIYPRSKAELEEFSWIYF